MFFWYTYKHKYMFVCIPKKKKKRKKIFLQENQRYQRNISCKDELDKGQKWYGPKKSRRY